ncbi:MAG: hypothetical protein EAZ95_05290 [Bacteroidetes bacterium]|nr:MAG: hypothetical protein EAZ95_05290 [Bacteroidota bacterium]
MTLKNSIFMLFLLASCTQNSVKEHNTDSQTLATYLQTNHEYALTNDIKTVFVLTEKGCMPCNQKVAKLMAENINKPNALFLVLATGKGVDLSMFPQNKQNILYDNLDGVENAFFYETKVLFMKNKQIDSTLVIEAQKLPTQLKQAETWLH